MAEWQKRQQEDGTGAKEQNSSDAQQQDGADAQKQDADAMQRDPVAMQQDCQDSKPQNNPITKQQDGANAQQQDSPGTKQQDNPNTQQHDNPGVKQQGGNSAKQQNSSDAKQQDDQNAQQQDSQGTKQQDSADRKQLGAADGEQSGGASGKQPGGADGKPQGGAGGKQSGTANGKQPGGKQPSGAGSSQQDGTSVHPGSMQPGGPGANQAGKSTSTVQNGAESAAPTPSTGSAGSKGQPGNAAITIGKASRGAKRDGKNGTDASKDRDDKGTAKGKGSGKAALGTVDDHSVWQEARRDPEGAKAAIENVIQEAAMEVGLEKVPDQFKGACGGLLAGDIPGEDQYELQGDEHGQIDWRRLLRRYVGQALQVRPVFNRPPRRFPNLVGIVPGKRRQPDRPKIMAVIDTSGSIRPELLELIDAELAGLARHHEVKVVECDCEIHRVYDYRPLDSVTGRGGTDFRPPLETKFLRKHRPDLVVFFTDGLGPAPAQRPRVKVIWCLAPGGQAPVDWGKIMNM